MSKIIGQICRDLPKLHRWAERQPVRELLRSSYAPGRLECYYGFGVSLLKHPIVTPALKDSEVEGLGDRLFPGWDSALLCKYAPGVGIRPHRDHTCFTATAVMVNIGKANFFEYDGKQKNVTPLEDGVIVRINTKILHGVEPVQKTRYSLTFRQIKAEYLTLSLPL